MLGVVLRVLAVSGILLLAVLGLALAILLLVLFFPITYRIRAEKNENGLSFRVRAGWLFGLVRVCADGSGEDKPPVKAAVKVLCFPVWRLKEKKSHSGEKNATADENGSSGATENAMADENGSSSATENAAAGESGGTGTNTMKCKKEGVKRQHSGEGICAASESADENIATDGKCKAAASEPADENIATDGKCKAAASEPADENIATDENSKADASESADDNGSAGIRGKFEKIRYTIRSVYDKIKAIWQNISYYRELLLRDETKQLFGSVLARLVRILKSLGPSKVRAEIIFGTGSPDTTGYVYGVYSMFMPLLGKKVKVEPDFERTVLEGSLRASGFVVTGVLVWHVIRVALDGRLRSFLGMLKPHPKNEAKNA